LNECSSRLIALLDIGDMLGEAWRRGRRLADERRKIAELR
jgi:hypothetical protein